MNREKEIINTEYGEYNIEPLISNIFNEPKVLSLTLHFPSQAINEFTDRSILWGFITIQDDGKIVFYSHKLTKKHLDSDGFCNCKNTFQLLSEIAGSGVKVSMEAINRLIERAQEEGFRFS
jgi:hypothetical protein